MYYLHKKVKKQKAFGVLSISYLFCFLKSLRRTPALLLLSFLAIRKVSHIIQILIFYVQKDGILTRELRFYGNEMKTRKNKRRKAYTR